MDERVGIFRKLPLTSVISFLFVGIALLATVQGIMGHLKSFQNSPAIYTDYNNYVIFKYSFFHLLDGKDLYRTYPAEHWDLYKYSPTFSFLFAPLAYLPDFLGLFCWNLINCIPILIGVRYLRNIDDRNKFFILLFILVELLTSLQNSQSNGIMAGLMLLAFVSFENGRYFIGCLFILLSIYIKIYGGIIFILCIFYPGKWKMFLYSLFWLLLLALLPLLITSPDQLIFQYKSWWQLLVDDHAASSGISVFGILSTWFNADISKLLVSGGALLLFLLPLINLKRYSQYQFRLLMLCSGLIWIVIFNHKSESPTFVIALLGVAIWYFSDEKTPAKTVLILLTFVLTTLSVSDLVPHYLRDHFVKPYCIKAVMPIICWVCIFLEQMGKEKLAGMGRQPVLEGLLQVKQGS